MDPVESPTFRSRVNSLNVTSLPRADGWTRRCRKIGGLGDGRFWPLPETIRARRRRSLPLGWYPDQELNLDQRFRNSKMPSRRFQKVQIYWSFRWVHLAPMRTENGFNCCAVLRRLLRRVARKPFIEGAWRGRGEPCPRGHPGTRFGIMRPAGTRARDRRRGALLRRPRLELTSHALALGALVGGETLLYGFDPLPRCLVP